MSWGVRFLRLFTPAQEKERMEVRRVIHQSHATADELMRTITMQGEAVQELIRKAFKERK